MLGRVWVVMDHTSLHVKKAMGERKVGTGCVCLIQVQSKNYIQFHVQF